MKALLVVAALFVILVVFVRAVKRRAEATLRRAGHELPPEVRQQVAMMQAAGARPGAAAAAAVMGVGAAPAVRGAAPLATPVPRSPHFVLIYEVGPGFVQQRAQFRDEHLALAWKAAAAGDLVLAGALEEPTEQAFLLFRGTREAAQRFAQADPYVRHGLVTQWRVKQWHTVVGDMAAQPVRPGSVAPAR